MIRRKDSKGKISKNSFNELYLDTILFLG